MKLKAFLLKNGGDKHTKRAKINDNRDYIWILLKFRNFSFKANKKKVFNLKIADLFFALPSNFMGSNFRNHHQNFMKFINATYNV